MKKIASNYYVELFILAGKYLNSISAKSKELVIVGFPLDWIK